jgi:hypothetical protein
VRGLSETTPKGKAGAAEYTPFVLSLSKHRSSSIRRKEGLMRLRQAQGERV